MQGAKGLGFAAQHIQEVAGLLQEHVVALEVARRVGGQAVPADPEIVLQLHPIAMIILFGVIQVEAGGCGSVIPEDAAQRAGDLQRVAGGLLVVVQVQAGQAAGGRSSPVGKAQTDLGVVFDRHVQPGAAGEGPEGIHLAQQPAQVIERVGEGAHHAAAQVGAGGIALLVIFPGVPVGQVFAPMRAGRDGNADGAHFQPFFYMAQAGVVAELEADQHLQVVLLHGGLQAVEAI